MTFAMDSAGISKTLDTIMGSNKNILGALIIDSSTGLCLGARGKATEEDGAYLTIAAKTALDAQGIGAVLHKDCKVLLRKSGNGVLVAVYKPKGQLSDDGTDEL